MSISMIVSLVIFIIAYVLIALETYHKSVISMVGAVIFITLGYVSQNKAFSEYVDWNVIFLLIGMMIMMGIVKETGMFQYVAIKLAKLAKGSPIKILLLLFFASGIISAFLDNVTTIIIMTPISILISVELGISPLPFVISQILASNIGGTATLIGDPPNLMIGSAAGLTFIDFLVNLTPVIILNMIVTAIILWFLFKKELVVSNQRRAKILEFDEKQAITSKKDLIIGLFVITLFITLFFLHHYTHLEPATIALLSASVLLLRSRKLKIDKFFATEIEWGTILFFIALFIMVGALEEQGVIEYLSSHIIKMTSGNPRLASIGIVWTSGIASAIIDNIPFVATMIPLIEDIGLAIGTVAVKPLWWALSLGACLGGNGTMIGASANLIAIGICNKSGYKISFMTFTKYGAFIAFINLIIATIYLLFAYH
ncbi:MAG TPA: ArsB/NhaD family transporter [Candidatus Cloacimonadota bacterium]|nr:ArsB/NhaD family transporter [Candidatus Cloacimonadales bacterium]HPY96502.1 ArsB/NhaD family transporter [Candidatus Cloacimonadota bacterium]HQB41522.1 ArsB/NhaD family transporter [Candidatus Cloacimonadota bacterium]